tara:strand:- start:25 stop:243 length:219 start_codon:yes stop_codon:yes gene_type:complete
MLAMFSMFFTTITNFFSSANNLASALNKATATVDDRAGAFQLEQQEENAQRLAYIKAKQAHSKANPETFEFS